MVPCFLFRRTESHTAHGRPTQKDEVVHYECIFQNGSFRKLKVAEESMNRKGGQSVNYRMMTFKNILMKAFRC